MPIERLVSTEEADQLKQASREWPSWDLTPGQTCDLELILNGAFAPLRRFLSAEEAGEVENRLQLPGGTFWPTPIYLEVSEDFAANLCEEVFGVKID